MRIPADWLIKIESRGLKWKRKSFVRLFGLEMDRIELFEDEDEEVDEEEWEREWEEEEVWKFDRVREGG